MKLHHSAAVPQTWVFLSDGSILQNQSHLGSWEQLGDGFFRIHLEKLRLCGLPAEYTARLEADFLTLYFGGEEMFTGRRLSALCEAETPKPLEETVVHHGTFGGISVSSVFGPQDESSPQKASPKVSEIYEPWIGVWTPTKDHYSQRHYVQGKCTNQMVVRNSSQSFWRLRDDGVYKTGLSGPVGTWRRSPDGRMLLDQGQPGERYYVIRQTAEGTERIGPYNEDGSHFKAGLEYTFYESMRQEEEPRPVIVSRPVRTSAASQTRSGKESWIGAWIPAWTPKKPMCIKRTYDGDLCVATTSIELPPDSYLVLLPDERYREGHQGRAGTWKRTESGRLLLDEGTESELYFEVSKQGTAFHRVGPFKSNGQRLEENVEYTYFECVSSVEPAVVKQSVASNTRTGTKGNSPDVPPVVHEDWRDVKEREWRVTGRWRGNIGGCWVTSRKHPDDWEHPHNK